MKNPKATLACLALGLALLAGCETSNTAQNNPSNAGKITLMFAKPEKPFTDVGTVSTLKSQPQPGETWQNALQRQASARGADAIIVDTSTLNNPNTTMVTGKAIKYQ